MAFCLDQNKKVRCRTLRDQHIGKTIIEEKMMFESQYDDEMNINNVKNTILELIKQLSDNPSEENKQHTKNTLDKMYVLHTGGAAEPLWITGDIHILKSVKKRSFGQRYLKHLFFKKDADVFYTSITSLMSGNSISTPIEVHIHSKNKKAYEKFKQNIMKELNENRAEHTLINQLIAFLFIIEQAGKIDARIAIYKNADIVRTINRLNQWTASKKITRTGQLNIEKMSVADLILNIKIKIHETSAT